MGKPLMDGGGPPHIRGGGVKSSQGPMKFVNGC